MSTPIIVMGANGRMGRTICTLVQEDPAFTLAGVVERSEFAAGLAALSCPVSQNVEELLQSLDGKAVVVDFTAPEVSLATARSVAKFGAAHVIGTTGFTNEQKQELAKLAESCRMFWAPNMSIGVNVLLKVLPELTRALGEKYDIEMVELHHNRKKDSPSGTALRLGECLAEAGAGIWTTSAVPPVTASSVSVPRRRSASRPFAAGMWSVFTRSTSWAPASASK